MTTEAESSRSGRTAAVFGLLLIAATWGVIFAPIKIALQELTPLQFLHLRLWFAIAFLIPYALWKIVKSSSGLSFGHRGWVAGLTAGSTLTAIYWLQTAGLGETTASKAGFITGLTVVIVPLFYAALRRTRPEVSVVIATLVSFIGLILASANEVSFDFNRGDWLLLVATAFNATHIIMMGTIGQRTEPVTFNAIQSVVNLVIISALLGNFLPTFSGVSYTTLAIAAGTGFYAIGVLLLIQSWAQKRVSPVVAGLAFTTEPIFAAVTGYLLLDESISNMQLLGFALVFAAMVAVEARYYLKWPLTKNFVNADLKPSDI
nr:DMT family transporter [uncultured Rhodoferax sp.]